MAWRFLFISSVLLLSAPCLAEEPQAFFPVMAWDAPPNDLAVLKRMRECGVTVAGFVPPGALDNCQEAGLKAIVADARVSGYDWQNVDPAVAKARVTELVGDVRDHPAGWHAFGR